MRQDQKLDMYSSVEGIEGTQLSSNMCKNSQRAAFCEFRIADQTKEVFQGCQDNEKVELKNQVVKISEKLGGKQKLIVKEEILYIQLCQTTGLISLLCLNIISLIYIWVCESAARGQEAVLYWKKVDDLKKSIFLS